MALYMLNNQAFASPLAFYDDYNSYYHRSPHAFYHPHFSPAVVRTNTPVYRRPQYHARQPRVVAVPVAAPRRQSCSAIPFVRRPLEHRFEEETLDDVLEEFVDNLFGGSVKRQKRCVDSSNDGARSVQSTSEVEKPVASELPPSPAELTASLEYLTLSDLMEDNDQFKLIMRLPNDSTVKSVEMTLLANQRLVVAVETERTVVQQHPFHPMLRYSSSSSSSEHRSFTLPSNSDLNRISVQVERSDAPQKSENMLVIRIPKTTASVVADSVVSAAAQSEVAATGEDDMAMIVEETSRAVAEEDKQSVASSQDVTVEDVDDDEDDEDYKQPY